jgi:Tol biopolymer transport system component
MRGRRRLLGLVAVAVVPLAACEPSDPAVERVSRTSSGGAPNGASHLPVISDDGRYVAYVSQATNLVEDDDNGTADVFRYDRTTGETDLVSVSHTQGNGPSGWAPICFAEGGGCTEYPAVPEAPAISDDGRVVAFTSFATTFDPAVAAQSNIFVSQGPFSLTLVSRSSAGVPGNGPSKAVAVSGNGRFVSFWSYATNLVPGDTNGAPDVFVHDLWVGSTTRVNTTGTGMQSGPSNESFDVEIGGGPLSTDQPSPLSDDGRFVAFLSTRTDLAPGGSSLGNVYRKDRQTGAVIRISDPQLGNRAEAPFISGDGNLVSFLSAQYYDVNRDAPCVSCFSYTTTGPPLRLVRNVSGGFNTELLPGNPFPGAPDVSGDGSLRTFAFGGDDSNIYVRRLPATALVVRHRINAGGPQFAGRLGKTWAADRGFVGGNVHGVTNAIAFTADDALYQTERWGMQGYDLAVPDGRYRVRLLVAEISPASGRRVFDVRAEGALVVDDFDTLAEGRHAFDATTLEFVVPVTDGRLDLDFSASSNAPTVAAIEVLDARLPDERI